MKNWGTIFNFVPGANAGAADGGCPDIGWVELACVEVDHVEPPRRPQFGHVEEENLQGQLVVNYLYFARLLGVKFSTS